MNGVLVRLLAAGALLALSACGVAPERDPQPLPAPSPTATAAVGGNGAGTGHPFLDGPA